MKVVYKYQLKIADQQNVLMPRGPKILSAGLDGMDRVCVWALVDTDKPTHVRSIRVAGTGYELEDAEMWTFVGSVMQSRFVWHVFVFCYEGGEV